MHPSAERDRVDKDGVGRGVILKEVWKKKKQEKGRGKKAKIEKRFYLTAGCAGWRWSPIHPLIRSSPPLPYRVETKNIMSLFLGHSSWFDIRLKFSYKF